MDTGKIEAVSRKAGGMDKIKESIKYIKDITCQRIDKEGSGKRGKEHREIKTFEGMIQRSFSDLKSKYERPQTESIYRTSRKREEKNLIPLHRIIIKFKRIAKCNFQKLNMWLLHKPRMGSVKDLFQLMNEGTSMMINLFKEHLRDRIYTVD